MAGPWEDYQTPPAETGPWSDFGPQPESMPKQVLKAAKKVNEWVATRGLNAAASMSDFMTPLAPIRMGAQAAGIQLPDWAQWFTSPGSKPLQTARKYGLPETNLPGRAGRIADVGVESALAGMFMPGGTAFGALIPNAIAGMSGEGVGMIPGIEGTKWEPLAKVGGALLGGTLASAPQMFTKTTGQMVREATPDMTPADWQAAQARQAQARQSGVPLMAHESIPRVPDAGQPINQLYGNVAASPAGGQPIRQFQTGRLPGMKSAIERSMDPVSPPIADPKAADLALAQAADKSVKAPMIARSAAAKQQFAAAADDLINPTVKSDALAAIAEAQKKAVQGGPLASQLSKLRSQINDSTTVGQFDEIYKNFKEIATAQAFNGETIPDTVRTALKPIVKDIRSGLVATNPKYAAGMEKYSPTNPLTQEVEAAGRSGAGQISAAYGGMPDKARGLFGKWIMDPDNARPATVKADMARLKAQDPNAANAALRLYVENASDAAFQRLQSGPQTQAGSKFTKAIAGTDMQRANLVAAVEGATGNKTTAEGFAKLLDILDRTGQTPAIGSPTATRAMAAERASSGPMATVLEGANVMRGSWLSSLQNKAKNLYYAKNYGELARLTIDPDGVKKLHELALLNPQSARARALAQSLVQGARPEPTP